MAGQIMRWRRQDVPGDDSAVLLAGDDGWTLSGRASFEEAGDVCKLAYRVLCDPMWRTRSAEVVGMASGAAVNVLIDVRDGRWFLNGDERPGCEGCVDVDLSFTPATNLLSIRRLGLAIGQSASVRAAWLSFPSLELEPLDQVYARESEATYRYESRGGEFVRTLTTNDAGFVVDYPGQWQAMER